MSYKNRKLLHNPEEKWHVVEGTHEPIIDPVKFDMAQEVSKLRTREKPATGTVPIFSGITKCGDCGRSMTRKSMTSRGKKYVYLVCSTYEHLSPEVCTKKTMRGSDLELVVLDSIQRKIRTFCDIEEILKDVDYSKKRKVQTATFQKQLTKLQSELANIDRIKLDLHTDLKMGIITQEEYTSLKLGYAEKSENLAKSIVSVKSEIENVDKQQSVQSEWFTKFKEYRNIETLTREIVTALIQRINIFDNKRIEIVYKFSDELEKLAEAGNTEV